MQTGRLRSQWSNSESWKPIVVKNTRDEDPPFLTKKDWPGGRCNRPANLTSSGVSVRKPGWTSARKKAEPACIWVGWAAVMRQVPGSESNHVCDTRRHGQMETGCLGKVHGSVPCALFNCVGRCSARGNSREVCDGPCRQGVVVSVQTLVVIGLSRFRHGPNFHRPVGLCQRKLCAVNWIKHSPCQQ